MLLSVKLYSQIPFSLDRALTAEPIRWKAELESFSIQFAIMPFSFSALKLWESTLKSISFQISGLPEVTLNEILANESTELGGPETASETMIAFCNLFKADQIEYLSDLLIAVSVPIEPTETRAALDEWGKVHARPWHGPNFDIVAALRDFAANCFDPVSAAETMHAVTRANVQLKKKLLNPKAATKKLSALQKAYQTLRELKTSR